MVELISLHIPRTAGTTFYKILSQVYGEELSISIRRKDVEVISNIKNGFHSKLSPNIKVIHGHLYYDEVRKIHLDDEVKIITWLREPVSRVISNYRFFMDGLHHPTRNPQVYAFNKHRINETLLEFAQLEENRNRMSKFLAGIAVKDLFFVGLLETFEKDLNRLSQKLNWPEIEIPHLNSVSYKKNKDYMLDKNLVLELESLNALDVEMYNKVLQMREQLK